MFDTKTIACESQLVISSTSDFEVPNRQGNLSISL